MVGLAVLFLLAGCFVARALVGRYVAEGMLGADFRLFAEIGRRWTEDGSMYAAWQLSGPYRYDQGLSEGVIASMPTLYPPYVGPVFAVVRFLPAVLWWAIPLAVIAWLVIRSRPAPWTWPLIAVAAVSPNTTGILAAGGSSMWITMFVALGLRYGWPAALVAFKPTFLPLAILGWRDRRTWLGLSAFAVMLLLMWPELDRYLLALQNVRGVTVRYSVGDLPFVLIPVIATLGASRTRSSALAARIRTFPERAKETATRLVPRTSPKSV